METSARPTGWRSPALTPRCRSRHRGRGQRPHGGLGAVAPAREIAPSTERGAVTMPAHRNAADARPMAPARARGCAASGHALGGSAPGRACRAPALHRPDRRSCWRDSPRSGSRRSSRSRQRTDAEAGGDRAEHDVHLRRQFVLEDRDRPDPDRPERQAARDFAQAPTPVSGGGTMAERTRSTRSSTAQHTMLTGTLGAGQQTYISPTARPIQCDSGLVQIHRPPADRSSARTGRPGRPMASGPSS